MVVLTALSACRAPLNAAEATRAYPLALRRAESIDIQVFREGTAVVLVNATTSSFHDFDLWLNERFVRSIGRLEAGETIRVPLAGFHDESGERFEPGGFFSVVPATPLWKAELELAPDQGLVGLVTVARSQERRR